ncbi:hypothetical protein Bbelb_263910 [Branchiostoma belcheri]|nr:hypothetical protein Bbelb_263910 [Branchiostoma belcheri]
MAHQQVGNFWNIEIRLGESTNGTIGGTRPQNGPYTIMLTTTWRQEGPARQPRLFRPRFGSNSVGEFPPVLARQGQTSARIVASPTGETERWQVGDRASYREGPNFICVVNNHAIDNANKCIEDNFTRFGSWCRHLAEMSSIATPKTTRMPFLSDNEAGRLQGV